MVKLLLDLSAILNVALAIVGIAGWIQCYRFNHTRFRILYVLWIVVSLCFAIEYTAIAILSKTVVQIDSIYSFLMYTIRPLISTILGTSAVTAWVMVNIRRNNANGIESDKNP